MIDKSAVNGYNKSNQQAAEKRVSERFSRTELLFGKEAMKKLASSRVAVFGIGGVGGYTAEALVRSGVGEIDLIDNDRVSVSNINRQIVATDRTVGRYKVDVMKERAEEINPACKVGAYRIFYMPETAGEFDFTKYDYIVDAVDTVTAKLLIVENAKKRGVPVISAMGAGNKLDPTAFRVADISETRVCPLARVMRRELKKRGIERLKVVYSEEEPTLPAAEADSDTKKRIPASNSFVPAVAGLILAGEIVRDLIGV